MSTQTDKAAKRFPFDIWLNKHQQGRSVLQQGKYEGYLAALSELEAQPSQTEHLDRLSKALGMLAPKGYWFANLLESIYLAKTTEEAIELAKAARVHIDKSLSHGPNAQPSQTEDLIPVGQAVRIVQQWIIDRDLAMNQGRNTFDMLKARMDGYLRSMREEAMDSARSTPQPSAPTVDIHAMAEDLTAHLAKMSLPTDPHGWKVIVRIALIGRLTKLLTNP
jgi:hypothetical protein